MPETPAGSEADPTGAGAPTPGAVDDGAGTVDAAEVAALEARRDAALKELAGFQSGRDKLRAEIAALEASKGTTEQPTPPSAAPTGDFLTREDLIRTLQGAEEVRQLTDTYREQYPNADPAVLRSGLTFDSPEQFRAAVMDSHQKRTAERDEMRKSILAELRESLGDKADELLAPAPGSGDGGGQAPSGTLTAAEYLALPLQERHKVATEHPEMVQKLLGATG